ncbi:glycoside hydrolase family 172 protein [Elongatibacter sediminis]|uniref:Glycoside hydrolase family 172 protein n=1 Tax=Elongatibacter sediminis TaxID=3119006 RepID=A0AAW9RK81_9GAMM
MNRFDYLRDLHDLPADIHSRSISFENPTGEKGAGGRSASPLGVGRKGSPARMIAPGECVELANIEGPGVIRHLWMTTYDIADTMRGLVIRMYWEDQEHPAVQAPLGDFFGFAHGVTEPFHTAVHAVSEKFALSMWLPMPFARRARITITNDLSFPALFFYQIDYTVGDRLVEPFGRLHAHFRRENPTTAGRDFEVLPRRRGSGRFLGTVIGVRPGGPNWWGEGEVRVFLDGDESHPTIVGTGTEDYAGLSWGLQQNAFPLCGASRVTTGDRLETGPVSLYRWHLPDPLYWHQDIRVTVQQIGLQPPARDFEDYLASLYDREDDWCACTFWSEPVPGDPLPPLPDVEARLADLDLVPDPDSLPLQGRNENL